MERLGPTGEAPIDTLELTGDGTFESVQTTLARNVTGRDRFSETRVRDRPPAVRVCVLESDRDDQCVRRQSGEELDPAAEAERAKVRGSWLALREDPHRGAGVPQDPGGTDESITRVSAAERDPAEAAEEGEPADVLGIHQSVAVRTERLVENEPDEQVPERNMVRGEDRGRTRGGDPGGLEPGDPQSVQGTPELAPGPPAGKRE
jgi:hypothetical protein